jgi:hypothetical protein
MADKQDDDKRPKWEQPEIEDFQEESSKQSEGGNDERVVVASYQTGCYPRPYGGNRSCSARKGLCYPYGYGSYPWYMYCAPRYSCYPSSGYYGWHGTYCRPYGFNYGYGYSYGYGCYPRR